MPGLSDEIKVANLTICCETRDEADVRNYPYRFLRFLRSRHLWYCILPTEVYWRGEQIQFLKKVNKEQDFKIHYISFVCKERCLDFCLGCVNFCSLTAIEHICWINPFAPRQVIGGRFCHFKLKSVDQILWCYQYGTDFFDKTFAWWRK